MRKEIGESNRRAISGQVFRVEKARSAVRGLAVVERVD
jgi:hypothetical protein